MKRGGLTLARWPRRLLRSRPAIAVQITHCARMPKIIFDCCGNIFKKKMTCFSEWPTRLAPIDIGGLTELLHLLDKREDLLILRRLYRHFVLPLPAITMLGHLHWRN